MPKHTKTVLKHFSEIMENLLVKLTWSCENLKRAKNIDFVKHKDTIL